MDDEVERPDHGLGRADRLGSLHNTKAEQALLGALLTKPQLLAAVPSSFDVAHYGDPWHVDIHRALIEIGEIGVPAAIAVGKVLAMDDREMRDYITSLLTAAVGFTSTIVAGYAHLVTEMHRRRRLEALGEWLRENVRKGAAASSPEALIAGAMQSLEEITGRDAGDQNAGALADAVEAALERAERVSRGEQMVGRSTGFPSLDEGLGGLEAGTVTVLAGRPGMGKSALAHQICLHVAKQGVGVGEFSLEMSREQLGRRALSVESGVPLAALRFGRHQSSMEALYAARNRLRALPLVIEDAGGLSAGMIALKARAMRRRFGKAGLGLVMVDHLHIVRPEDSNVKQGVAWAIGRISGAMKQLAKDLACPVLLCAQLSRGVEGRDDKRPNLADLRSSGDIEQDADAVAFVYRGEYYLGGEPERIGQEQDEKFSNRLAAWRAEKARLKGRAEIILAKVREGEPKTVGLQFDGATTSFREYDHGSD